MADDLRFCMQGCCLSVNNQPVNRQEYDAAVARNNPGWTPPGVLVRMIPCRKHTSAVEASTEASCGYYFGAGLRQMQGRSIADGQHPAVYDKATNEYRRQATDEDIKRWNDAWKAAVEKERAAKT
jgi:hypothetical protein